MTRDEMEEATASLTTKSAKIRTLARMGVARSEIAKYLNIRYQHVRNVLVQPVPTERGGDLSPAQQSLIGAEAADPRPLTIAQAKLGLAAHFGIAPDAIEITIRG